MNFKEFADKQEKILYICRGLPGSGKSTMAKQLAGSTGVIYSTDDFFMQNGKYNFNPGKLGEYHQKNFERAKLAMEQGVSPIVVDNTNTTAWEPKKYVQEAIKHGYKIEVKEPNTPWKFDVDELSKKNTHNVPTDSIKKMLNRWHHDLTVDDILNSK